MPKWLAFCWVLVHGTFGECSSRLLENRTLSGAAPEIEIKIKWKTANARIENEIHNIYFNFSFFVGTQLLMATQPHAQSAYRVPRWAANKQCKWIYFGECAAWLICRRWIQKKRIEIRTTNDWMRAWNQLFIVSSVVAPMHAPKVNKWKISLRVRVRTTWFTSEQSKWANKNPISMRLRLQFNQFLFWFTRGMRYGAQEKAINTTSSAPPHTIYTARCGRLWCAKPKFKCNCSCAHQNVYVICMAAKVQTAVERFHRRNERNEHTNRNVSRKRITQTIKRAVKWDFWFSFDSKN